MARRYDIVTFDCYGTLVDWERGACTSLSKLLSPDAPPVSDDELVRAFLAAIADALAL